MGASPVEHAGEGLEAPKPQGTPPKSAGEIVDLQGRKYANYPFVLSKAHAEGLAGISTELVQVPTQDNGEVAIVRATVRMENGAEYSAYGDASPANVTPRIRTALLRMAETRAKGRALRDAVNIGETLAEELPDEQDGGGFQRPQGAPPQAQSVRPAQGPPPEGTLVCSEPGCGVILTQGQYQVSAGKFGRALCPSCQHKQK